MKRRTGIALTAAMAAVVATGAGTAITVGADGPADGEPRPTQVIMPPVAQAFPEHVVEDFAVASSPAKPIAEAAVSPSAELAGASPAAARFARTAPDGTAVYVMPSKDGFCVTSSFGVESGCYTSAAVDASAVICAPGLPPDEVEVFGVAPDDVATVEIALADGSSSRVSVEGNVFIFRTPKTSPRPLTINWTDKAGEHRIDANVPADFRDDRCAVPPAGLADLTKPGAKKPAQPHPSSADRPVFSTMP